MKLKELGSVCDLQNGYAFKSDDYVEHSQTVSLRMSNIRPGGKFDKNYNLRYLPDSFQEKHSNYLISEGDLVIAMTDLANDPKILGIPTIVETGNYTWLLNQRAGKLIVKDSSKADKNYLRYILNHPIHRNYYKMFAGGGLQINIGKKEILGVKIPIPPLKTQQHIAQILDDAAALRDKTKQLLTEYDLLAQSVFLEMFGDPVINPKEWAFKTLNELTSKLGDGLHGTPQYDEDGEYYFINGNNLIDGVIVVNEKTKKVVKSEYEKYKKELNESSMLVSINGTIGKVAFYNKEKVVLGKSACYFNIKKDLINSIFLYKVINSHYFLRYAKGLSTGSTIKNVSLKTMRAFPVPYPPIELQNQFAEKMVLMEKQKELAQQELQESEDLFNSLLQKAFKGEL